MPSEEFPQSKPREMTQEQIESFLEVKTDLRMTFSELLDQRIFKISGVRNR